MRTPASQPGTRDGRSALPDLLTTFFTGEAAMRHAGRCIACLPQHHHHHQRVAAPRRPVVRSRSSLNVRAVLGHFGAQRKGSSRPTFCSAGPAKRRCESRPRVRACVSWAQHQSEQPRTASWHDRRGCLLFRHVPVAERGFWLPAVRAMPCECCRGDEWPGGGHMLMSWDPTKSTFLLFRD